MLAKIVMILFVSAHVIGQVFGVFCVGVVRLRLLAISFVDTAMMMVLNGFWCLFYQCGVHRRS